ncbi:MAG: tetratricopeptide repeat protein, partial [Thiotrichaceae bacterium]|nr:tetratricopeptide repeat protein [Thiotrichaceae bacterium]
ATTQNNLAVALQYQGNRTDGKQRQVLLSESIKHSRLALEIRTEKYLPVHWKQSRNNLAKTLNSLAYDLIENPQRLKEARKMLLEAVEINPKEPAYRDSLGWAEYRLGNLQEAEKLLQQAFAGFPHPEIASHLIEVLWKRNKHSKAKQLLAKMLKEHPKDAMLLAVKKRLKIK